MTWNPLSKALWNMLLYVEDQKQEKEAQFKISIRSKVLLFRLPPTQHLLPPIICNKQGTQYVLVRHAITVRKVSRSVLHIFSS